MSRPRAATSVATSTLILPVRKLSRVRSRWFCAMSPWRTSTAIRLCKASVRSSASLLVAVNMIDLALFPYTEIRSTNTGRRALGLGTCRPRNLIVSAALSSLVPTRSMTSGSRRYCRESFWTQFGMVALKSMFCLLSGILDIISSTASSKPTLSIWSASSKIQCFTSRKSIHPRSSRSMMRPGVPTATSTPRRISRDCAVIDAPP
mmetsp:Transcript_8137/g.30017  ORF Transcript_8137/g.30017 Transcript_8137/m.30017 type:complete len:205 (+) Transcript_8137:716-1330(+)